MFECAAGCPVVVYFAMDTKKGDIVEWWSTAVFPHRVAAVEWGDDITTTPENRSQILRQAYDSRRRLTNK